MTVPAVLLSANAPAMQYIVGGMPLLTRHILELYRLGVTDVYLLGPEEGPQAAQHRLPADVAVHPIPCAPDADFQQQLSALPSTLQEVLVLWAPWLVDPRLWLALLMSTHRQWLSAPDESSLTPVAARLSLAPPFPQNRVAALRKLLDTPQLDPIQLDTYSAAHRGRVPFYLQAINTPVDAATATHMLITSARKKTMDIIAGVLDTVLVNRLVYWLSYTPVTPNQITLGTGVLGAIASLLFLAGWLRLGVLLAYAAATLDGVDGKLARATLQFSKVGELEHVLDFFMEQSWYLTITIYLVATTGETRLWWIGGSLMLCDMIIKILYGVGRVLFGKQLEELGAFDRQFRRIGGRRNIYMAILFIGFCTGFAPMALMLSLAWALLSLYVHAGRMTYHYLNKRTALA